MGYCRVLVYEAAERHGVPPVYVTAHVRVPAAVQARAEVMVTMIDRYGMKRWQVAFLFGRAKRRVRASVLRRQTGSVPPQPTRKRTQKVMVPVLILPGNQFAWDFSHWIGQSVAMNAARKAFHPGRWIREIPEETVRALSDDERKALRKRLRMQLARL